MNVRSISLAQALRAMTYVAAADILVLLAVGQFMNENVLKRTLQVNVVLLPVVVVPGLVYVWRRTRAATGAKRALVLATNFGIPLIIALAAASVWLARRDYTGAVFAAIAAFCIYQAVASYLRGRRKA